MPLDVAVSFPDSPEASTILAEGCKVRRFALHGALSELFELTLEILSTDPNIAERAIVGRAVVVTLGAEPFLKEVRGIVRAMEQRTAVPGGDSHYVWSIVPPLWLTTRRRDSRIFQNMSVPEIINVVLADASYGGRIRPPVKTFAREYDKREYTVQYDETDWAFLSRLLADAGIASYFDHVNGSQWILLDDTSALAPDGAASSIPFSDPVHMNALVAGNATTPHVQTAVVATAIETSAVTLRDFDFTKPTFNLEAKAALDEARALPNELPLEAYTFEVGKFDAQPPGDARAQQLLHADRNAQRRVRCTASFALQPGVRMTLTDHPRADLCAEFLVVRLGVVMEADDRGTHEIELMDLATPFQPSRLPKPRIHGTQSAFVRTRDGDEIDVDVYGRVLVEFPWDRRDQHQGETSRRVRVSQAWAGEGYGLVTLPRRGDEVVVAYLDGDPDQPIIVGRVHNALSVTPLKLPDDKTVSVWRSRSSPGGGGYNQILLDDKAGAERMEMHAQRDFKQVVEHDAETTIVGNETRTVKGNRSVAVVGNQGDKVKGNKDIDVTGDLDIHGKTISIVSDDTMELYSGAHMQLSCATDRNDTTSGNHAIQAGKVFIKGGDVVQVVTSTFHVFADAEIHLQVGGSSIHIEPGSIKITSAGPVEINGAPIKLNC
jgi:type VI secretion system secreted protein VgrG